MQTNLTFPENTALDLGDQLLFLPNGALTNLPHTISDTLVLPDLAMGSILSTQHGDVFQVCAKSWFNEPNSTMPCLWLTTLDDVNLEGTIPLDARKEGFSLAWITLSDKGSRGEREDLSGPAMENSIRNSLDLSIARGHLIPDDPARLKGLLTQLALTEGFDLILTSGGTGLAPTDLTPQATLEVIEHRVPGFERAMTMASLKKTPHALLSRAVVGTLGNSLIINLPGSPKGVTENLEAIMPAMRHALEKIAGDPSDCAR